MKGAIDEGKDVSPMFPRLHVKDAEKGGPKAPPRNKMALYEQFSIPSQSIAAGGPGSGSLFSLPLRNCAVPATSSHLGCNQSIKFCSSNSNAISILSEKTQAYNSRKINLTKLTVSHDLEHMKPAKQTTKLQQDNYINSSKSSLKTLDGEDAFITPSSVHVKSSYYGGVVQNEKDEDKLARCNLSFSFKSLNSFRKVMNSSGAIELKSSQYGKNRIEEHKDASQIDQKAKEKSPHSLNGFDETTNESSNSSAKYTNSKSMKEEIKSISVDSLKALQGSNGHIHEDRAAFVDKNNFRDHCMEKPAMSDVQKSSGELEIGRRSLHGKRERSRDEETSRNCDALNKSSSECRFGLDIIPDDVVGLIGEKQFWKTRKTIINQQRIFFMQVFELHRLVKVQRLIAGSPNLLFEDNLVLNKPPTKTPSPEKLQSNFVSEQPLTVFKHDSKSEKAPTSEDVKNSAVGNIPFPCVNNISKEHNRLSYYGNHHLGNLALASSDKNSNSISISKQSSSIVYPPPPNQWLVPVMSPSEGLVYKPIIGPCPPNAGGIMTPLYGACGALSLTPGTKDVLDPSLTSFHQKIGILSGSSLPQLLPPCVPSFMHRSISSSSVEQMGQSSGPKNRHSYAELNSAILYQSPSNMSTQISQVMSRNISTYQSLEDNKELQVSTASSPSKRMKGDELPLFPLAPTFWSSPDRDSHVEHQSKVIKALPHNKKSASESAAKIFMSIQDERKVL
ncbi:ELF3-like protein 2 [Vicia villosa]|uniref:ELF3-like protein 2 n=1 Tax=Vicia villosa TaxID=3911 RepID=UPI00273ACC5B|nr:ELF3-like protein 2 [Vicia villosa]